MNYEVLEIDEVLDAFELEIDEVLDDFFLCFFTNSITVTTVGTITINAQKMIIIIFSAVFILKKEI